MCGGGWGGVLIVAKQKEKPQTKRHCFARRWPGGCFGAHPPHSKQCCTAQCMVIGHRPRIPTTPGRGAVCRVFVGRRRFMSVMPAAAGPLFCALLRQRTLCFVTGRTFLEGGGGGGVLKGGWTPWNREFCVVAKTKVVRLLSVGSLPEMFAAGVD